ncbi:3-phosphoshikimate 1-carboxyvinyltransferase [Sediminicola luteus]|uniref:3-phosphoshikimate 1-carboxyvinyltransferase n=1 Tax=Sediminicola luteus TaxID=319238 RepID=UPI001FE60182|nr:3-phosphoshikimate 1-carboxyvinyltransferase [Sediminicola luteus]
MKATLTPSENLRFNSDIVITGSKSETNRLLLLQALFPNVALNNVSNSDDAQVMQAGLGKTEGEVDIHHAGTAMRFLTAFFATQAGREVLLTGSPRMKERPIKVLVEALQDLGADISYAANEGYPPLKIKGNKMTKEWVSLPANISSQYISALLLNAPHFENGLTLELIGEITSVPYIKMTLRLLDKIGVKTHFEGNTIQVWPKQGVNTTNMTVESDWSSASYFYSIMALAEAGSRISLTAYTQDSLQGDSVLQEIYRFFGVETTFADDTLTLTKKERPEANTHLELDLVNAPDIAQTIAVSCFALGISCDLVGLHTLKIKETDRLEALQTELSKLGAQIEVTDKSLHLKPSTKINEGVSIATYHDHRMAMAFAPLAFKVPLYVEDAMVVSKSYPDFWTDMEKLGLGVVMV